MLDKTQTKITSMVDEILSEISTRLSEVFDPTTLGSLLASGIINIIVILVVFFAFYLFWRVLHWGSSARIWA